MNKNTMIAVSIAAGAVLIGTGSFYAGLKYSRGQFPMFNGGNKSLNADLQNRMRFFGEASAPDGQRGGFRANGNGAASGEIISKDDKSITVKLQDGGSKIIFLSESTTIMKSASGSASDLASGEQVTAMGTPNPDGSITAQSIQIRSAVPQRPPAPKN